LLFIYKIYKLHDHLKFLCIIFFFIIRKWKSDSSDYDSETDKEEIPRSKSLAALRRQKQPTRRPTTKLNPRFNKRKSNSYSANSDDEDASKSRLVMDI